MADHKYLKKIYIIKDCAVFRKTHEKNGGLSNMAAGYPVYFNGTQIRTSEALYQGAVFRITRIFRRRLSTRKAR